MKLLSDFVLANDSVPEILYNVHYVHIFISCGNVVFGISNVRAHEVIEVIEVRVHTSENLSGVSTFRICAS